MIMNECKHELLNRVTFKKRNRVGNDRFLSGPPELRHLSNWHFTPAKTVRTFPKSDAVIIQITVFIAKQPI